MKYTLYAATDITMLCLTLSNSASHIKYYYFFCTLRDTVLQVLVLDHFTKYTIQRYLRKNIVEI